MKFRDEQVDDVIIETGNKLDLIEKIKKLGKTHTIIDLQYGFTLDKDYGEWYSVLILAKEKSKYIPGPPY